MDIGVLPVIDGWYRDVGGNMFMVVAWEEEEGILEIHHFEGELEQIDIDSWNRMELELISPPEDWDDSYDNLMTDDFGDAPFHSEGWDGASEEADRWE
ncbi:MAG: DUF6763 family protein [Gammaproteobacteria bacterium]